MKKISMLLCMVMLFSLMPFGTKEAKAADPCIKDLSLNKTYYSYDVTGDGVKDTLKIYVSYMTCFGEKTVKCVHVKINGENELKFCYDEDDAPIISLSPKLIRLENGKCFLYMSNGTYNDYKVVNALYQFNDSYTGGHHGTDHHGEESHEVCHSKIFSNSTCCKSTYNYSANFCPSKVEGNDLYIDTFSMNCRVGCLNSTYKLSYESGSLKRCSSYTTKFCFNLNDGHHSTLSTKFTLDKSITGYTSTALSTKVCTFAKGEKVCVTKIRQTSGKLYLKVKRCSDGKIAWISGNRSSCYSDGEPLFKSCHYAG